MIDEIEHDDKWDKRVRERAYKYSHIGCHGVQYDDNCDRPYECAEAGGCRILREQNNE
jgi:hypothetical protein